MILKGCGVCCVLLFLWYGFSISAEFDKNINALKPKAEKYFNKFDCLCDSQVKQVNSGL